VWREYRNMSAEDIETFLCDGKGPVAEKPCFENLELGKERQVLLQWYAKGIGGWRQQFFFPLEPPDIPEWEHLHEEEWDVVGIGPFGGMRGMYKIHSIAGFAETELVAVIGVNRPMEDLNHGEMYGRFYAVRVLARKVKGVHMLPENYAGELGLKTSRLGKRMGR
jgi:hypothetical protein